MSSGLFFTPTPGLNDAPLSLAARPGNDGKDGVNVSTISQNPADYRVHFALDDGRSVAVEMRPGPPGRDAEPPRIVEGTITLLPVGSPPDWRVRLVRDDIYAIDLYLPDASASALAAQAAQALAEAARDITAGHRAVAETKAAAAAGSATAAAASVEQAAQKVVDAAAQVGIATERAGVATAAAAAALDLLDAFDDRYLGAKASDPATDNDGNALVVGALYYRSGSDAGMRVWTGTAWNKAYAQITGGVQTFKGREGAVVPQAGDYAATQIAGLASRLHYLANL